MFCIILADWDQCYRFWTFRFDQKLGIFCTNFGQFWGLSPGVFPDHFPPGAQQSQSTPEAEILQSKPTLEAEKNLIISSA